MEKFVKGNVPWNKGKKVGNQSLSVVSLKQSQIIVLNAPTPKEFIKTRQGKGGKNFSYVEVGYVINQLNRTFGPLNWSFQITERGETQRKVDSRAEGELWVYGELTIHDHANGYKMVKGQYGQHPVYPNVPYGDALKSAESDALKKAASLVGIALDVFWKYLDVQEPVKEAVKITSEVKEDIFTRAKSYIAQCNDVLTLKQLLERVDENDDFTVANKVQLKRLLNDKINTKTGK